MSPTILVPNIGRCWNLKGTNKKICRMNYTFEGSEKEEEALIAFSNDPNNSPIDSPFKMSVQCTPDQIRRGECKINEILQPIKCDPKTGKCDPYYYRTN